MKFTLIKKLAKLRLSSLILPLLIFSLAAFLRLWQLGDNPPSLFMDEASNGYNAYSILKTAKDEYGNFMPLTFRAFGDYNPALSVYTLVPSVALFGLNEFSVRLPSSLLGTATVIVCYFLTRKLLTDKIRINIMGFRTSVAILASLFLAISPWHIQFSRYDHEANFMIFFTTLSITFFLYSSKNLWLLVASSVFLGLALNSYHAAKVWVPLVIANVFFWFKIQLPKPNLRLSIVVVILFIFAIPFILNFSQSLVRAQSVGLAKENQKATAFVKNYLAHFSPTFLFLQGDLFPRHSISGMGTVYIFEIPLVIAGIMMLIKQNNVSSKFILCWLLLAPIPASLANPAPHALRSLTFMPVWAIISACGLVTIANSNLHSLIKRLFLTGLFFLAIYNFSTYLHLYYKHYPKEKAPDWQSGYKEMVTFVKSIAQNYTTIAITDYYAHPYIFVLFYSQFEPSEYQIQSANKNAFDKYEFFGASWEKTKPGKALVVTPSWQAHPPKLIKQIYDNGLSLKFNISEAE